MPGDHEHARRPHGEDPLAAALGGSSGAPPGREGPSAEPLAALARAGGLAREGFFSEAWACLACLDEATAEPRFLLPAAVLAYVVRRYDESLALFERAAERSPALAHAALGMAVVRARRLGWNADTRRLIERAIRGRSRRAYWHVQAERLFLDAGAPELALPHLRAALLEVPNEPRLWIERATVAASAESDGSDGGHRTAEVTDAIRRALELNGRGDGPTVPLLLEAASAATRAAALPLAVELLERASALDADDPRPLVELAERRLWCGDVDGAEALGRAAARVAGRCGGSLSEVGYLGVRRVLGAADVLRGDPERGLDYLGHPLGSERSEFGAETGGLSADYQLHLWRGEALYRLDRRYEAHRSLTAATMAADGFAPSAWVLRLLLALREGDGLAAHRDGEVREFVRVVARRVGGEAAGVEAEATLDRRDPAEVGALLERTLTALSGNRSTTPTCLVGGAVERLPPVDGERRASRRALLHLRAGDWRASLARLEAVVQRYPGYSLPDAHLGELLLWVGDVDGCRAALERAIASGPYTRWAYIGLAGAALLAGEPERALAECERGVAVMGSTGPAVYAYRGEAYLRLGRLDEAVEELERAVSLSPSRLGAWIALSVAKSRRGDADVERLHTELLAWAPGLVSDAAREVGVVPWPRRGAPDRAAVSRALEHALTLLRGNRGSTLYSYFTGDGRLRFVESRRDDAGRVRDAHAHDASDLALFDQLLARASEPSDLGGTGGP